MFALGVALAWLLAQRLLLPEGRSVRAYVWFSVACLVLGLIRPEGVLISVFMLSAVGVLIPRAESSRLTAVFAGVFVLLGVTYFVWRWQYFGHPLPNPFYKKGGGLHISALKSSVKNSLSLGLPFIPMWLLATRSRVALRQGLAFLLPIVGATCMWVLISDEMNFGARFQYPILVLYVLSWYPLVRGVSADLGLRTSVPLTAMQRVAMALAVGAVVGPVFVRQVSNARRITYSHDGRLDIGLMLKQYADRGYTIATTEAGLLPLYSQWRAIDTWGLNDRWIAENGGLTKDYLSRRKPDILMWHGAVSRHSAPSAESAESWSRQGMILKEYAEERDFTLAAAFGRVPEDTHDYYVRPDLPEHDAIVRAIRATAYRRFDSGEECTNFAVASRAYPSDTRSNPVADVDRPRR